METIERAIHLFTTGEVSIGRAACLAGMSREDFMRVLGERQIPIINYEPDDVEAEMARLHAFLRIDPQALLDMCRENLIRYDATLKAGQCCAAVVAHGRQLVAMTTDGEQLVCATIEQVVEFLRRKGIASETLTMPDWRAGDSAPSASEQIQIRAALR